MSGISKQAAYLRVFSPSTSSILYSYVSPVTQQYVCIPTAVLQFHTTIHSIRRCLFFCCLEVSAAAGVFPANEVRCTTPFIYREELILNTVVTAGRSKYRYTSYIYREEFKTLW